MSKVIVIEIDSEGFKNKVLEIVSKFAPVLSSRYMVLSDGWIKDVSQNKDFGPISDKAMNKADAIAWCKKMGGYLPTRDQLESLQDLKRNNPCCDPIFKDMKSDWYWTDTPVPGIDGASFVVSLYDGYVSYFYELGKYYVRPCRSSQ